jgi:hypothetical protein
MFWNRRKSQDLASPPPDPEPEWKGLSKFDLFALVVFRIMDLLQLVCWFGGLSLIAYCLIGYPLSVTAGKQTGINVIFQAIVTAKAEFILSLGTAAAFGLLWKRERKLHRQDIKRFASRIRELESQKDIRRTSSGLTETGDEPKGKP